jgi:hypothetical protein
LAPFSWLHCDCLAPTVRVGEPRAYHPSDVVHAAPEYQSHRLTRLRPSARCIHPRVHFAPSSNVCSGAFASTHIGAAEVGFCDLASHVDALAVDVIARTQLGRRGGERERGGHYASEVGEPTGASCATQVNVILTTRLTDNGATALRRAAR